MKTLKEYTVVLFILLSNSTQYNAQSVDTRCDSPQYLELGKTGTINCIFYEEVFAVLWYTEADFENGIPALQFKSSVKSGAGYESGEFDVHSNGSLIIKKVLLRHENVFTVAYMSSKYDDYDLIEVRVIVVVKSEVTFPVISICGNTTNICFAEIGQHFMQCSVSGVRPHVSLELSARTVQGDKVLSTNSTITPEAGVYTSRVVTRNVFRYSSRLVLLVCKASAQHGILNDNESAVLAMNSAVNISEVEIIPTYVEYNTRMQLKCSTDYVIGFIVWKKIVSQSFKEDTVLAYSVFVGEQLTDIYTDDLILGENDSLVANSTEMKHEGLYSCTYGDGVTDGVILHNVTIVVFPDPAYPVVDGCGHQEFCVLEAQYEGTLTCTVKGIRPRVQLRWQTIHETESTLISFTNQRDLEDNGDTFDATLVSQFQVKDKSLHNLTVQCDVVTSKVDPFNLKTTVSLHFVKEYAHKASCITPKNLKLPETGTFHQTDDAHFPTWVIPVIVVFVMELVCVVIIKSFRIRRKNKTKKEVEDNREMVGTSYINMKDMKEHFLKQLQEKYMDLYDAVQPIPYIKDKLYCVERVFVEGGIEYLELKGGGQEQWIVLESYQNVLNDTRIKSKRRILEGEPGFGKSTVTLQFAYDWCNSTEASALREVDILILLRLRQLGGVTSIYRAIKQFILPKDSRLSESDVEIILRESHSVVIMLDGFDEYPDQNNSNSDVVSIVAKQMFQDFEVVLTTRSSFLPEKRPPSTKRLRLTGFDDNARRYYIRKAVVGDDDQDNVEKIEGYLEKNPILNDLCQVPLLFVLFAHMTYESEDFRNLNSVTSFFRYMISCFHNHMRNKMKDENVSKFEIFEIEHGVLDKIAFEALSDNSQRIVWKKDELILQLGPKFYDQYIRIGILVEEEEVLDIIDDPCTPVTEHVQYRTEVRFYHKLFCEWYAAHYLSGFIEQNPNIDFSEFLQHLDPFDVQHLYRFSCGLNYNVSKKIIKYLQKIEGGVKVAILCILEQTGKIDKEILRRLCFEGVIISGHDSPLLQRSSMQILEIAARNDIPIRGVNLYNCFQSVDLSTASVCTTSNLALTSKIPIQVLGVSLHNREMTEDEYLAILAFSSMCPSLRNLRFEGSAPPKSFKNDLVLSTLFSRKVEVRYFVSYGKSPEWILNLLTGRWERRDGFECKDEDFEQMNLYWAQVSGETDEDHKRYVQKFRENLREKAQ